MPVVAAAALYLACVVVAEPGRPGGNRGVANVGPLAYARSSARREREDA
jgi:hypothetical protein